MRRILLIIGLLLKVACSFSQKGNAEGLLIYTLGTDTTMIGSYKLSGRIFELEVLSIPNATVYIQKGELFDSGELKWVEGSSYRTALGMEPADQKTYTLYFKDDTTYTEITAGNKTQRYRYQGKCIINNMIGATTFFLFPFWPSFSPSVGDSLISQHMWGNSPKKYLVKRTSPLNMTVESSVMGKLNLFLNEKYELQSIDGIGSSLNLIGHINEYKDMDSIIQAFRYREHYFGKTGPVTLADSVFTTIINTHIKIYYNRPFARGRRIFGYVVPHNRFWRTGANRSTLFICSQPIRFGEQVLPAGEYSIFTLPKKDKWILMFNSAVGIWGTEYDASKDVLRAEMKVEELSDNVEAMTIEINPHGAGGILTIKWERTMASAFFSVD